MPEQEMVFEKLPGEVGPSPEGPAAPIVHPQKYEMMRELLRVQESEREALLIAAHIEASIITQVLALLEKGLPILAAMML